MQTRERTPAVAPIKFVAVNVTPEARDALRLMAVKVSAAVGKRVSMSDALAVVDAVAQAHAEEIADTARRILDGEGGGSS